MNPQAEGTKELASTEGIVWLAVSFLKLAI